MSQAIVVFATDLELKNLESLNDIYGSRARIQFLKWIKASGHAM